MRSKTISSHLTGRDTMSPGRTITNRGAGILLRCGARMRAITQRLICEGIRSNQPSYARMSF